MWFSAAATLAEAPSDAEPATLEIGAEAPDFELPGVDGRRYRLAEFADSEVLVVVFTCNHCPTAQAYESRIKQLVDDYRPRGVALVAISPNDPLAVRLDELGYTDVGDTYEDMKLRATEAAFDFPYLYDGETQSVTRAYGPIATPHAFVFDRERKLRYRGRIDDAEVGTVTKRELTDALEAVLAGRAPAIETTRVPGCSIKWASKRGGVGQEQAEWQQKPVELAALDLDGVRALRSGDGKTLRLINVWATYCGPCLTEIPAFVEMQRMYGGREFEVVLLTVDAESAHPQALERLRERHAAVRNYRVPGDDLDQLAEALDAQWPGPLPHTVLVDSDGTILYRKTGEIDPLEVRRAIVQKLGRTYPEK
jgi:peroxiredoxin